MGEGGASIAGDDAARARALHTLLERSQYGLLLLDEQLRVLWVSNAGAASLRYEPAELVGRVAGDFLDSDQSPGVLEAVREVLRVRDQDLGWQLGVRVRLRCGDGVSRDFEFGGRPVAGRHRELLLVFLEVSDRARLEDVLTAITEHDFEGALERFLRLATDQLRAPVGVALHPSLGGSTYATPGARASLFDDLTAPDDGVHVRPITTASGAVAGWLGVDRHDLSPWALETMERLASVLALVLANHATLTDLVDAAATDPLTGLSNRRILEFSLLAAETTPASGWALLYCDLDRFKSINDDFGHDAGDAVLRAVADRLTAVVRSADVIARIGGDEFIVLAQADLAQADQLEARVRAALAAPIEHELGPFEVGVSIGMATADTAEGVRSLLTVADHEMRREKALHRRR